MKEDQEATTLLYFILDQLELVDIIIQVDQQFSLHLIHFKLLEQFGYHLVDEIGMIPLAHLITTHQLVFKQKVGPLEEFWKTNQKAKQLLNILLKKTNLKQKFILYGDPKHAMTILELFIHDRNVDGDIELFKA